MAIGVDTAENKPSKMGACAGGMVRAKFQKNQLCVRNIKSHLLSFALGDAEDLGDALLAKEFGEPHHS